MNKINILSSSLANKIAAGEVVERPSSVVKELLENSIDAKSTSIKIIIKEFGIKEIRVIDNGVGIANDDIEKAFLRHSTSKIKNDYDLFHINTLGFRGEALASIASVSDIEIKSCSEEEQGKFLKLEAGKIVSSEFYPPIKGTDILVKNLFYNTPARLKYLKNANTEQGNILNIINKLALSYPSISFEFIADEKIILKTYGDNDRHKVIAKVYNTNVAKNMLTFYGNNDDYKVSGYMSSPEETRANKNYINIFINGRYVKNYQIQNAVIEAYGSYLMKNRYPIIIININMDSVLIDVNVHPTKQEVRLSKENDLIQLLKKIISERLSNNTYIPDGINNVLTKKEKNNIEQISYRKEFDNNFYVKENKDSFVNEYKKSLFKDNFVEKKENFFDFININDTKISKNNLSNNFSKKEEVSDNINLPDIKILAQIFKTYILGETGDELYLIDQHAAQERYNYEKIQKEFLKNDFYKKQLLIPLTFSFFSEDSEEVKNILDKLSEIGLVLEEFGSSSFILRDYPSWIEDNVEETIEIIIEKVKTNKKITVLELINDVIAMASCKASIKANQVLSLKEMQKVLDDLYSCKNPFTCPHGRPIITKINKKDLEKIFKRIV